MGPRGSSAGRSTTMMVLSKETPTVRETCFERPVGSLSAWVVGVGRKKRGRHNLVGNLLSFGIFLV